MGSWNSSGRTFGNVWLLFLLVAVLLVALADPVGFAAHLAGFAALLVAGAALGLAIGAAVYLPAFLVVWLWRGRSLPEAAAGAFRASCIAFRGVLELAGSITP